MHEQPQNGVREAIIWEMDARSRRFTYVSSRAEALLGYPLHRWLHEPGFWGRIIHPEDRERTDALFRDSIDRLTDQELEYRVLTADARTLWIRDRLNVVSDPHGAPRLLQGVMVDITAEKAAVASAERAELQLRRLNERLRALAAAAPEVVAAESPEHVLDLLRETLPSVLRHDAILLGLYDEERDDLELVSGGWVAIGEEAGIVNARVPLAGDASEPVIRERRSLVLGGNGAPPERGDPPFHSRIRAPIQQGERILGVLGVASRSPAAFDTADVTVLETLASLAGAALTAISAGDGAARFAVEPTASAPPETQAPHPSNATPAPQPAEAFSEAPRNEARVSGAPASGVDARLSALLQETTAAAIEAATFSDAAARCIGAICSHLGWPAGRLFVRTDEDDAVSTGVWDAHTGYREIVTVASRIRCRSGIGIVGRVLRTGEPVWSVDATRESGFLGEEAEVRGAFAFGVPVGGRIAAVLEFVSRQPAERDAALIAASARIGLQLARVLERENAASRIRFQARLLDAVGEAVVASDLGHRITYFNRAAEALFGWSRDEALGRLDSDVMPARPSAEQTAEITTRLAAGETWSGEYTVQRRDGENIPVHITGALLRDETGAPSGYVGVATDLRRSKALEQELRQAQTLEAAGRLAGGIAHEFNNLLTSIKGSAELALADLPQGSSIRQDMEEISSATDRAAGLTAQLLAFTRRQVLQARVVDLNRIVNDALPALRRSVGENVQISTELAADPLPVKVDTGQIVQVLMSLAANAREAMPASGRITLRTRVLPPASPGRGLDRPIALLEVEDTGRGIPAAALPHVFEPFFTTKDAGVASGLGLSGVYGIVRQSGGDVHVRSTPGSGTIVAIQLPMEAMPEQRREEPPPTPPAARPRTVLLVEDEETVRRLARRILDRQGYQVLEAGNGVEALDVCERHPGEIDLVISDVVMPLMSGAELIDRLHTVRPGVPVLLMSGYTGDSLGRGDLVSSPDWFLEKPFSPDDLVRKVRAALDTSAPPAG